MRRLEVLAPFGHRTFRMLWMGQTVSSLGNHVRGVAVPFQLLALGASPLELGAAIALNTIATIAFLVLGGAVADRVARRALILGSDVAGGCVVALIAVLSASGQLEIEHLYIAAVVLGAADAFLAPAYSALIAEVIPANVLRAGNAARLLGRSIARVLGPSLGGLVVVAAGPHVAFGFDAVTFFFSFATLLLAKPTPAQRAAAEPIVREIREGFRQVFALPWLWTTIVYFMLVNVAYAGQPGVLLPLFVQENLDGDAAVYGWTRAAYGVGTIVAGLSVAQLVARHPGRLMYRFEILAGAALLAMGLLPTLPVALIGMALMGLALSSSTVIWQELLQRYVPSRVLGRVTSIDLLGNSLINPVGPLAAAAGVGLLGPATTLVLAGGYALLLALIAAMVSPVRTLAEPRPEVSPPAPG